MHPPTPSTSTALPTIIHRSISWPGWCMAATLVAVGQLLIAQNGTLGARLSAASMLIGPSWVGAVFAGVVGSIAKNVQNQAVYIVLLCLLTILAFALLTALRAARPPHFIGYGILLSLVFVIPLVDGEFVMDIGDYWGYVWRSFKNTSLAAACVLVSGVVVFPTLAGSELQTTTAHVLLNVGRCMSRCGGGDEYAGVCDMMTTALLYNPPPCHTICIHCTPVQPTPSNPLHTVYPLHSFNQAATLQTKTPTPRTMKPKSSRPYSRRRSWISSWPWRKHSGPPCWHPGPCVGLPVCQTLFVGMGLCGCRYMRLCGCVYMGLCGCMYMGLFVGMCMVFV